MHVWANAAGVYQTRREWAFSVVDRAPGRERGAGMVQGREQRLVQKLFARSLNLSMKVFCVGLPNAMYCQSILRSSAKARIAFEGNWVQLSLTTVPGFPRASNSVANSCPCAGLGRVDDQYEAFPRSVIDDGHDPEAADIGQLVGQI